MLPQFTLTYMLAFSLQVCELYLHYITSAQFILHIIYYNLYYLTLCQQNVYYINVS